jgi:putative nucleotidyltransferase with HDIG domain
MDKVDRYIERVQHLPPAPAVLPELQALFTDPNRDTEHLAELIGCDPSLTAEVLKRCNSAFFRGTEPPADIFEAVSHLGFQEVQYVVTAVTGPHSGSARRIDDVLDTGSQWRHSLLTAQTAAALASQAQHPEGGAFTVGLLHDVGKLIFASIEGQVYRDLIARAGEHGSSLARAEAVAFGATHAEVGARLLTRWGLPTDITLAVLHHHGSPAAAAPFQQLAATLGLADRLAQHLAAGTAASPQLAFDDVEALELLALTAGNVPEVLDEARERFRHVQELLRLPA